jgi:hypothetical protein
MPQGLQTFNEAGSVVLDTTKLVIKRVTSIPITVANTSLNTVPVSVPATQSILGVTVTPVSGSALVERIEADFDASNVKWKARTNDGQNYRLDVMMV